MPKEIRIPHSEISDSQTITDVNKRKFKELGLDIHRHEVEYLEDDFKTNERVLGIKTTLYFRPPSDLYRENYKHIRWDKTERGKYRGKQNKDR